MRTSNRIAVVALMATLMLSTLPSANACPFCSAPSLTLTEQLAQSDAVALVQWVKGTKPDEQQAGSTKYKIVDLLKGPKKELNKGDKVSLVRYRVGKPGDLFVLMGTQGTVIEWGSPLEVSETGYQYMAQAPSPEAPIKKRLAYFLKFLESQDQLVANDAYGEFANAPYEDIAGIAELMPRERIRSWIADPETPATRMGLYGLLIGLCGSAEDVRLLQQKITQKTEDFRLGIDGVMSGYLLLTGEEGLDVIDEYKLKDREVPFSETYAAMQALRFVWQYTENRISKDRLRKSMRILLDRPELADLVIADLARWKDWSVQDELMALYDMPNFNIPSIKRAVVRYMLVCAKDAPEGDAAETPDHVDDAQENLELLRKKDPKTVREAERFFFIN